MRLTLRQLEIFRAVALTGSTIAAARSVPLSQSATSASLNELERALKARLFDRVGKRLLLNDNGRALLPTALAVLDGARHVETAFSAGDQGSFVDLHLFASTTIGNYVLPPLLARFRASHPDARLELRIGNTRDVVVAVRDFSTDLGFIEGPCHATDVTVVPWSEDELLVLAAPSHPLATAAARGPLTGRQLGQALWLLREPGSGTREEVERALLTHLPSLRSTLVLGSAEAIMSLAAEGVGLCCLSRCAAQSHLAGNRLAVLTTSLPRLTRRFSLIHHDRKVLSDSLRRFMQAVET